MHVLSLGMAQVNGGRMCRRMLLVRLDLDTEGTEHVTIIEDYP